MFVQILLSLVCLCSCAVTAAPQTYGVLKVSHPQPNTADLGPYDNLVGATIDILPDITDVFQKVAQNRDPSSDRFSLRAMENIFTSFFPITEKILRAAAKAEGRDVTPGELERLERAQQVLPGYFRLMEDIQEREFQGQHSARVPVSVTPPSPTFASPELQYGQKLPSA